MISDTLLALATCPRCLLNPAQPSPPPLRAEGGDALCCPVCETVYHRADGWVDLRPPGGLDGRETRYVTDAGTFAAALAPRAVGEPLLGAAVRQRWLRRWLRLGAGQLVLDIGCGDGRFALWNRGRAHIVALDAAPLFAEVTRAEVDLVQGDVRVLPFPRGTFDAAYSIDVMEHLDAPGLERFFAEAARVLKPGGHFYLYSNTRERSTLWPVIALWGRLSRALRRRGIGDFAAADLRKADHVKVLATWPQVVAFAAHHGLRVERVRFWNGVFQGLIDNVLVRLGEGVLLKRAAPPRPPILGGASASTPPPPLKVGGQGGAAPWSPRQALSQRPAARAALLALTGLMQLDVILFGSLRSGPFFALLRKGAAPATQGVPSPSIEGGAAGADLRSSPQDQGAGGGRPSP